MGVRPQLMPAGAFSRRGAALPAALFGVVTVSLLASAIFSSARMQSTASRNRESSARALQLAEDGLAHAVTVVRDSLRHVTFTRLLRGTDNMPNTADDGRVTGYNLSSAINIPSAGRAYGSGTYDVQIMDDGDSDGLPLADVNLRLRMRCTATTSNGGRAVLDVILGVAALPAIAANGDLALGGNATVRGACGGVHANDDLSITSPNPVVGGTLTASDQVSGTARDTLGAAKSPVGLKPVVKIPAMSYADYCGAPGTNATVNRTDVEFWYTSTGLIYRRGNPVPFVATAVKQFGWRLISLAPVTWEFANPTYENGKLCIEGNVTVSSGAGSAASPVAWSIIATGSVKVSGSPFIVPATNDSIAIIAGGDIAISGNPGGSNENYEGLIYANAQCSISGNPTVAGQVLCRDQATGVGNADYAPTNIVTGNPTLTYGCGGILSRRTVFSWLQRVE